MQSSDYEKFCEVMSLLSEVYKRELSQMTYKAYWEVLKDLDIDTFTKNATNHLKASKFFPTPSDLRNDIDEKDLAIFAWEKLLKAIEVAGYYESVDFQDKVIHSVVDLMGGWKDISIRELTDWDRKTFCEFYGTLSKKKTHPEYLVGEHELHNNGRGFKEFIKKPVLIECSYLGKKQLLGSGDRKLLKKHEGDEHE